MKTANIIKILLYAVFIAGIILSITLPYYFPMPSSNIYDIAFSISLAGLVGIGTNTIAIKMLFRPLNKTFFGRQGLLPKNKEKIAATLAETVKERIINTEAITNYLTEKDNLEKIIKKLSNFIETVLKSKETKKSILSILNKIKEEEFSEKNISKLLNFLEKQLDELFESNRFSFKEIFDRTRKAITNNKEKNPLIEESIEVLKEILQKLVEANSEEISAYINKLIDRFLLEKNIFAYLGKALFMDNDKIEQSISEFLRDKELLKETGDFASYLLSELDTILSEREVKNKIEKLYNKGKEQLKNHINKKELPKLIDYINLKIDQFLNNPEKISYLSDKIENYLLKISDKIENYLKEKITPQFIENTIKKLKLEQSVYSIVYKSIMKQNMREFEQLTQKIMSDNLAFIEIIGGILGMLIGISLTYKIALIIIPILIFAFISIDNLLTKFFTNNLKKEN